MDSFGCSTMSLVAVIDDDQILAISSRRRRIPKALQAQVDAVVNSCFEEVHMLQDISVQLFGHV